ncbi:MAG TPA: family 1 glycosylhydrolase, partial [Candidatus Bathyarchaeia archaeon]|nr:family 1 glycosylhydrolase [Candidatus Bathyarchaeia archaeon]
MNSPFASSRSYLFALILTGICSGAAHAINPLASLAFFGLTIKAFFKPLLGTDNSRGTAYENMWQQYYQKNADLTNNAENLAEFFTNALENNTSLANHLTTTSDFMFGLSSSHYQIEGGIGQECACHDFYEKNNKALPGRACDFWNKYEIFIQDLRYCGAKTFRMSISWERVYPYGPDNPDFTALAHYRKIIQALKNADIEPIIVLHHYTVPTWFAEMGGFENKRNITFFVDFAQTVYIELHDLVRYWSTFNAIEGYAFKGYYTGNGAPGKKGDLQKTADVMGNMLLAHAHTYKALKNIYEK